MPHNDEFTPMGMFERMACVTDDIPLEAASDTFPGLPSHSPLAHCWLSGDVQQVEIVCGRVHIKRGLEVTETPRTHW